MIHHKQSAKGYVRVPIRASPSAGGVWIMSWAWFMSKTCSCNVWRVSLLRYRRPCRNPYVIESTSTLKVLELFKQTGQQAALVIQEYGDIEGLITLNDILEAIVGDISSRENVEHPEAVQREDGSWVFDGLLPIEEMKDILHIRELPDEASSDYATLAGFVLMQLGRIPRTGDHFKWGNYRFEVLDMDGRRIDKVLVQPVKTDTP